MNSLIGSSAVLDAVVDGLGAHHQRRVSTGAASLTGASSASLEATFAGATAERTAKSRPGDAFAHTPFPSNAALGSSTSETAAGIDVRQRSA